MFTGIVEAVGKIKNISSEGTNRVFHIESKLVSQLKIDQSVNHNGICLTVEDVKKSTYRVTAIEETLKKTNAGTWEIGNLINLERSLQINGRLDGHIVQGHVDGTGLCISKTNKKGSSEFTFQFAKKFSHLIIEKGSVCINGVSLTAFNVKEERFTVAIIPFTLSHTNFQSLQKGDSINIEYDLIGKYLERISDIYIKNK